MKQALIKRVRKIVRTKWTIRKGQKVPDLETIPFSGGGVEIEAAFLFSDLTKSGEMVEKLSKTVSAKIYKSFLEVAAIVIRKSKGSIVSFDGDRIMAVFDGKNHIARATEAALRINYAVDEIINSELSLSFRSLENSNVSISQVCGVSVGEVLVVRAGITGTNDRIWVGAAPNEAAKLSDVRQYGPSKVILSNDVYRRLPAVLRDGYYWEYGSHDEASEIFWLCSGHIQIENAKAQKTEALTDTPAGFRGALLRSNSETLTDRPKGILSEIGKSRPAILGNALSGIGLTNNNTLYDNFLAGLGKKKFDD